MLPAATRPEETPASSQHCRIRAAGEADGEAVYRLICDMENRALPREPFFEIYREQLQSRCHHFLTAERDGRVVGVLHLRTEAQLHHSGRVAEILELAVDSACQSQGIGRDLFLSACQLARDKGCLQIEVACNQLRTNTHRFYAREGMHNFHFKFSMPLTGEGPVENAIGR